MKTKRILATLLALVFAFSLTLTLAACVGNVTVTYYAVTITPEVTDEEGNVTTPKAYDAVVIGTESVKAGSNPTGYATAEDGTVYVASAYFASQEVDTAEEVVLSSFTVSEDVSLYANETEYGVSLGLATGEGYTLNYATTTFPTTWNSHIYQTDTDSTILGYSSTGFYEFDYNETKDGYIWADAIAVGDPVDVTADYIGEQWGIEEGDSALAWKVEIRDDLCWDDGTPIDADDFITSTQLLLNPFAQNDRADDYTYAGNFQIQNARSFLRQGNEFDEPVGDHFAGLQEAIDAGYTISITQAGVIAAFAAWGVNITYAQAVNTYSPVYFVIYDDEGEPTSENFFSKWAVASADEARELSEEELAEMIDDYQHCYDWNPSWNTEMAMFCTIPYEYPEFDWDNVGIKKIDDTHIVFILDQPLEGFYLKYGMGTWLVKEDLYLSCCNLEKDEDSSAIYVLKAGESVYNTTYNTTVATSASYGPYKLAEYQVDKYFKLVKNENWWGYDDPANAGLYQTTAVNYIMVESASTRLQMFLAGQLDSYGLTADDMDEYQTSDYTYYTDGDSTWFIALNPNLAALGEKEFDEDGNHLNIDKEIITIKEFRQAMCYALDRAAYELACDPTGNPAKALFSPMIICNPEEGIAYRTTDEAKQTIVEFWGIADQIGPGKLYADIDEAIDSITGYNPALATQKFQEAYDLAVELEYIDEDDVVTITIGTPNLTSNYYNRGYDFLVNCYTNAVVGTDLEGRLQFDRNGTLGNGFADALRANQVDMLFGVGWTGSALDPYGLIDAYTLNSNQYDPGWNTQNEYVTIVLPASVEVGYDGTDEGEYEYTTSVYYWTYALNGYGVPATKTVGEEEVDVQVTAGTNQPYSLRLPILAAMEKAVLLQYDMIPIAYDSSASLKSMKIEFYTEEYIYGVGRGGIKYTTFNFNDNGWAEFVAQNGGSLDYTSTAD